MIDVKGLSDVMDDKDTLRILFYLKDFNPDVKVEELNKYLNIDTVEVEEKLNNLEKIGMVLSHDSKFKLSEDGNRIANSIYSELGETSKFD